MLLPLVSTICLTGAVLLLLEKLAPRIGLLDHPVGHSTHDIATPIVGGLGVACGIVLPWLMIPSPFLHPAALWGAVLMLLVGFGDDCRNLRARTKFLLQCLIVGFVFPLSGALLHTLGELSPGGGELLLAAPLAWLLTLFGAVGIINAVNMLDGLDGLAGSVVLGSFGWFAFATWWIGDTDALPLLMALIASITVFLCFNLRLPGRPHARLFLGDAGSLFLGFTLAWVAVRLSQRVGGIPPVLALWFCAVPVFDAVTVMLKRRLRGRPLMQAGRDHLHHLLRASGLSVGRTVLVESMLVIAFGLIGLAMWQTGISELAMLLTFLTGAAAYARLTLAAWKKTGAGPQRADASHPALLTAGKPGGIRQP